MHKDKLLCTSNSIALTVAEAMFEEGAYRRDVLR